MRTKNKNYTITVNGITRDVTLNNIEHNKVYFTVENHDFEVTIEPKIETSTVVVNSLSANVAKTNNGSQAPQRTDCADGIFRAPMPGILVKLEVEVGREIEKGQTIAIVEAMKMENALASPMAGKVSEVLALVGSEIKKGQALFKCA